MAKLPARPRDANQLGALLVRMATGEVPNDKEQALEALRDEAPTGRAKSAKARAASQTAERRSEVARKAARARWDSASVVADAATTKYEPTTTDAADQDE